VKKREGGGEKTIITASGMRIIVWHEGIHNRLHLMKQIKFTFPNYFLGGIRKYLLIKRGH